MNRYVLSLSGGGVKSIFSLYFLLNISHKFDLIVGTSAGGLIGSLIASGDDETTLRKAMCHHNIARIFNKSLWDRIFGFAQSSPVYDGKGKREVISEFIKYNKISDLPTKFAATTWNITLNQPEVITSYKPEHKDWSLVDVCDATSAAIVYFPPVKVGNYMYIDGGVGMSNPVLVAYNEAKKLFPGDNIKILSVGTGLPIPDPDWATDKIMSFGAPQWLLNGLIDLLISSPNTLVEEQMSSLLGDNILYIDTKIPLIHLDDTCPEKIKILRHAGIKAYEDNKDKLDKFFDLTQKMSNEKTTISI